MSEVLTTAGVEAKNYVGYDLNRMNNRIESTSCD